jgi:hypothetical protein
MTYNVGLSIRHGVNALPQSVAMNVRPDRLPNGSACLRNNGEATAISHRPSAIPLRTPSPRASKQAGPSLGNSASD